MQNIEKLIKIHLVLNCEKCEDTFYDGMCDAHTHGLDKFGYRELQMVLLIEPRIIGSILNTMAEMILNKEIIPSDGVMVDGIIEDYPVRLDSTYDREGVPIWRIIVPDENGLFPEETDNQYLASQIYSPYKKDTKYMS